MGYFAESSKKGGVADKLWHMVRTLSIVIPAYNEGSFIGEILKRVVAVKLGAIKKEIIIINDGSTDKTKEIIERWSKKKISGVSVKVFHKKNGGKGSAMRKGLKEVTGDVVIIQDADLEYDPKDYIQLIRPIQEGEADVVYGSRFMGEKPHRVHFFWHMVANNSLTLISNMFTNLNLTDMETGYKMFTADVAKRIALKENGFGMEPEFTAKIAKMKCRVFEVGISYHGRSYEQGKKIGWKDGVMALWCILRYNLFD